MPRTLSLLSTLLLLALLYRPAFAEGDTVWTVKIPGTSFVDIEYSPNGTSIAAASGWVYLLDPKDGSVIRDFRSPGAITRVFVPDIAFSADGKIIAAAVDQNTNEHKIQWWDVESGEPIFAIPTDDQANSIAFSPDGRFFVAGDILGHFWVWDISSGEPQLVWEDNEQGGMHRGLWFSQDGQYILYTKGRIMKLRRLTDSTTVHRWNEAGGDCQATPDLKYFIAAIEGGLGIYDREHKSAIGTLKVYAESGATDVQMTKGGRYLLTSSGAKLEIWDFSSRSVIRTYPSGVFSLSPDSLYIVSNMGSGYIRLYRFNTTITDVEHPPSETPLALRVLPNPAFGSATAAFTLPEGSEQVVRIDILDATGSLVTSLPQQTLYAGEHNIPLPVAELASGFYFCRLRAGTIEQIVQFLVTQ